MAPIPSAFNQETVDMIENVDRRKRDLLDFQIPRLRDFTGSLVTQQQYAAEVREDIELFSRIIEVRMFRFDIDAQILMFVVIRHLGG